DHVQLGPYAAAITADGTTAATFYSKTIDVAKNGSARLFRLEPGHEVRFSIALPAGKDSGAPVYCQIRTYRRPRRLDQSPRRQIPALRPLGRSLRPQLPPNRNPRPLQLSPQWPPRERHPLLRRMDPRLRNHRR